MEGNSETLDLAISQEDDDGIERAHFQRVTRNKVNPSSMSLCNVLVLDFNLWLMFKVSTSENRTCWWEILWCDYYVFEDEKLHRRPELQRVSWYCLSYYNEDIGKIWGRSID